MSVYSIEKIKRKYNNVNIPKLNSTNEFEGINTTLFVDIDISKVKKSDVMNIEFLNGIPVSIFFIKNEKTKRKVKGETISKNHPFEEDRRQTFKLDLDKC